MLKRWQIAALVGGIVLLLIIGGAVVFADEPTPTPSAPVGWAGGMWRLFDAAAEALGLTPEGLFAESHGGKSLDEIAEERGVEMDAVREAMNAARAEAMQQAIKQAVEDGKISQEQADWMLEGHEKGFFPMGRGFGRGWGRGRIPADE